ncbi:MAG: hypothetical protein JO257_38515 [Deltaproteobacteria bacterium]|nr:hypothetical protein [Deltaproteobacteria bacterium]
MRLWFVVAIVGAGRAAAAEPTYPQSEVDRPLLLYGGMTSLDLGLDFPTFVETTLDANGNAMTSKSTLGHYHDADVVVLHSFGNVEIGARVLGHPTGPYLQGRVLAYLGPVPGAVSITAQIKAPQPSSVIDHEYSENVGYTYKRTVVAHQLAIEADAYASFSELSLKPFDGSRPSGTNVYGARAPRSRRSSRRQWRSRSVRTSSFRSVRRRISVRARRHMERR